jgi:pimeloyl-ACP methyl ester carboxylesterase
MSNIALKSVQIANGETLGYREREGGDIVLLLVHGNMNSSKHWDLVLENADPRYKIYAVDQRGFGISTYNNRIDSLKDLSEDLKMFVDALGLKRFSLMGWSTGGGVVMQFAADYPEYVEKLILLASVSTRGYPFYAENEKGEPDLSRRLTTKAEMEALGRTQTINGAYAARDKETLRAIYNAVVYDRNQPSPEHYEEYLEDMMTQRNLADIYHALNTFNISAIDNPAAKGSRAAEKIQAPVLVLQGEHDLVVPVSMAHEIVEDIGANARLVMLEGCGHSALVDDLNQLLRRIDEFILGAEEMVS